MKYTPGQPEPARRHRSRPCAARRRSRRHRRARAPRRHRGRRGGRNSVRAPGRRPHPRAPRQGRTARDDGRRPADRPSGRRKGPVALADLAKVEYGELQAERDRARGPRATDRDLGRARGRSLGDLVPEMKAAFAKIKMPPGGSYHLDGQIRQMEESNAAMGIAFLLAFVFIYIVLAAQFESFIHPVTIMATTLPLAAVSFRSSACFSREPPSRWARSSGSSSCSGSSRRTRSSSSIARSCASAITARRRCKRSSRLAPERLRPILMTSSAMVLGMLPHGARALTKAASSASPMATSRSSAAWSARPCLSLDRRAGVLPRGRRRSIPASACWRGLPPSPRDVRSRAPVSSADRRRSGVIARARRNSRP